jgi:hypothetical protein
VWPISPPTRPIQVNQPASGPPSSGGPVPPVVVPSDERALPDLSQPIGDEQAHADAVGGGHQFVVRQAGVSLHEVPEHPALTGIDPGPMGGQLSPARTKLSAICSRTSSWS